MCQFSPPNFFIPTNVLSAELRDQILRREQRLIHAVFPSPVRVGLWDQPLLLGNMLLHSKSDFFFFFLPEYLRSITGKTGEDS